MATRLLVDETDSSPQDFEFPLAWAVAAIPTKLAGGIRTDKTTGQALF